MPVVDLQRGVGEDIGLVVVFGVRKLDEFGVPFVAPRFLREPDLALLQVGGCGGGAGDFGAFRVQFLNKQIGLEFLMLWMNLGRGPPRVEGVREVSAGCPPDAQIRADSDRTAPKPSG